MDPITTAAGTGLTHLIDYGPTGILLALIFAGGIWVVRYFAEQVKSCHTETKRVVEKNTEAFNGVQVALAKLEAKLEK
jgi:hypothetical protein